MTAGAGGGADERDNHWNGFLSRAGRTSKSMTRKSMTRKSFAFLHIGNNNSSSGSNRDEDPSRGDKTDRSETSENRSVRGVEGTTIAANGNGGENGISTPHHQNGSTSKHSLLPWSTPRSETAPGAIDTLRQHHDKEKLPLKERFSFGLGRKRSSKFLSTTAS
jgi:ubiquitin carboxyl-terminal hydrolase 9/13